MKRILTGATGFAGTEVLRQALADPRGVPKRSGKVRGQPVHRFSANTLYAASRDLHILGFS
ncbi:hypothetical protein NU688_18695 [Variovorax sp. ZS18.2.2]|uniref:hypothetical protein n=1 Tax=Variovorax sp. ZS18.2.2 TaxID=2971255 RepID=UPI0021508F28|nr:hypothetical protein [Variovorax sp. ZS18.2.2]MCR6478197.1 hypothetical protein [Variovorax sp. ZS18.2.2]